MSSPLKYVFFIGGLMGVTYFSVEDSVRAKFDNGAEEQYITLTEWKQGAYLFFWEFFGAHEEELKKKAEDDKIANMKWRKRLAEKREQSERGPAYVPQNSTDKFMAK